MKKQNGRGETCGTASNTLSDGGTNSAVVKALSASLIRSPTPSAGKHRNIKINTQLLEAVRLQVRKPAVKTSAGLCRSTLMDHGIEITSV